MVGFDCYRIRLGWACTRDRIDDRRSNMPSTARRDTERARAPARLVAPRAPSAEQHTQHPIQTRVSSVGLPYPSPPTARSARLKLPMRVPVGRFRGQSVGVETTQHRVIACRVPAGLRAQRLPVARRINTRHGSTVELLGNRPRSPCRAHTLATVGRSSSV